MKASSSVVEIDKCQYKTTILECAGFKRILQILHFSNEIKNETEQNHNELLVAYVNDNKLDVVGDYCHLIEHHLSDRKSNAVRNSEFFAMYSKCISLIKCETGKCPNLVRNNRDRSTDSNNNHFVIDLCDKIHVLMFHSYQFGFRTNSEHFFDEYQNSDDEDDSKNDDDVDNMKLKDNEFVKISLKMKKTRENIAEIRGLDRIDNNKFNNEIVTNSNDKNTDDQKQKTENKKVETPNTNPFHYSFGLRCYYWKYYKNRSSQDKVNHPTETYGQWYIENKYKDLKEEITKNPFETLSLNCYQKILVKADTWLKTARFKKLEAIPGQASDTGDQCYYDIKDDAPLQLRHLICLICYTDFTNFSYEFSKSFRKLNDKESNDQFRIRKGNYHFLSKGLRELVELYGTMLNHRSRFFTGISCKFLFPSFVARLCCPTSTTVQISVATAFAKQNGMIVTLKQDSSCLKYFNCSSISAFTNEDERLFIGGIEPIKFGNIRLMDTGDNFLSFISPITKFCQLLNCSYDEKVSKRDYKVLKRLIEHHLGIKKNKFDAFANDLFKTAMEYTKHIRVAFDDFHDNMAKAYAPIFLDQSSGLDGLVRIDYLSKIMKNAQLIAVEGRGFSRPKIELNALYLSKLLLEIQQLSGSVQQVKFVDITTKYSNSEWNEFVSETTKCNFSADVGKRQEWINLERKFVKCLIMKRKK